MLTLEGPQLAGLTEAELCRVMASVRKQFRGQENITAIGVGGKTVDGVLETEPRLALRFHVRRKYSRTSRLATIQRGKPLEVRIRRDDKKSFINVRMPSDVVRVERFVPTGVPVAVSSDFASGGLIFRLRKLGTTTSKADDFIWGMLSVGHFLKIESGNNISVSLASRQIQGNGVPIFGSVRHHTTPPGPLDASAIEFSYASAKSAGYFVKTPGVSLVMRSHQNLRQDAGTHESAESLRPPRVNQPVLLSRKARITDFYDEFPIDDLGTLKNIVRIEAIEDEDGLFEVGTSGSVLLVKDQVAAIQVAGRVSDFRVGLGQTVSHLVGEWLLHEFGGLGQSPLIWNAF